jgi:hypothetical protein
MAQTGFTPISIYYSSTATNVPTAGNLVAGELAINTADGKLFYKDSAGVVQVIGTKGGVGSSTTTQVLYNSSGLVVGSANMTFSGTALTLANDASISGLTVGKGLDADTGSTAVGYQSLASTTSALNQTAVGYQALNASTSGNANQAFGYKALLLTTTGTNNVGVGHSALYSNTTGGLNVAVGREALYSNTTASNNTAVGYQSSYSNTTGTTNTALGQGTLFASTTGSENTAVGNNALLTNTTGGSNTSVGVSSLRLNTTGVENSAFGQGALRSNTTGGSNVSIGYLSLYSNTTASNNTAVGYQAGYTQTTGSGYNTHLGYQSGYLTSTGAFNTFVGQGAGYAATTGTINTFVGSAAGSQITTGAKNTILGGFSGNNGGLDIRTASNYIVLSDGDGNPRGVFDGSGNFIVGKVAYGSITTNGAYFGAFNQWSLTSDSTYVNRNGTDGAVFSFYKAGTAVGSISVTTTLTSYNVSSDRRLKENIAPLTTGLASVLSLKPRQYNYKADPTTSIQGFIADELQQVVPHAVSGESNGVDVNGKPVYQGVDVSFLIPHLVSAIQELNAKVTALENK